MSEGRIVFADAENNEYIVDVFGYAWFPAQCVTLDELSEGGNVNIIDQYNLPPDETSSFGNIRMLPNTGDYTYSTNKVWRTADQLWTMNAKASLAYAFMFSSEKNPRWQDEYPLYNIGTVTGIIDEKYMWVMCRNDVQRKCRTDYMTCDTAAFSENDQVAVKFENCDKDQPVVVGFWNDPQPCGFKFKLIREDDTLISEASGLLTYFRVYNSKDIELSITEPEYEADTEYWRFGIQNKVDMDEDGYWVEYLCEDGIVTQYPYKYKTADKRDSSDLIPTDKYEDDIPYWNVEFVYDPEPVYISPHPYCIEDPFVIASDSPSRWWLTQTGFSMNKIVKSSIPFKVIYEVKAHYVVWRDTEVPYCFPTGGITYTAISADGLLNVSLTSVTPSYCIESGWISGNIAGFDAKIIIATAGYNCTQMWIPHSSTRPWKIYVSYEDFDPVPC